MKNSIYFLITSLLFLCNTLFPVRLHAKIGTMKGVCFVKDCSRGLCYAFIIIFFWTGLSLAAASYTATSLSQADVQTAVTACEDDVECTTVFLPADTSPSAWMDEVVIQVPDRGLTIEGQGKDATIINIDSANSGYNGANEGCAFYFNAAGNFAALKNVRINGPAGTSRNLVCFRWCYNAGFVISGCHIYGHATTAGLVSAKRCWKGLYANNYMEYDTPQSGTPYGFTLVGPSGSGPAGCRCVDSAACITAWHDEFWYADHGGGHTWNRDWVPGGDAVFIENSEFVNIRAAVEVNWASFCATVVRYNHFKSSSNLQTFATVVKPGNLMQVVYNNIYEWTGTGTGTQPHNGRANMIVHDNTYINIGLPGSFWPFSGCANGYLWVEDVYLDKFFVWNNTYTDCRRSGDYLGGGWDDYSNASENARNIDFSSVPVFGRAPNLAQDGFTYAKYDCPHPLTGLTGICGDGAGPAHYDIGGTPPPDNQEDPDAPPSSSSESGCFIDVLPN